MRLFFFSLLIANASVPGKLAPDLSAKLFSGKAFSLKDTAGKVTLVHFWATWCVSCQKEMPALDQYYKDHHKEGFDLIAISMDSDEKKAREMLKAYGFDGAMAKDANFKGYGRIWRLPVTFIIDKTGKLQKEDWDGEQGIDGAELEKTVTPLLRDKI